MCMRGPYYPHFPPASVQRDKKRFAAEIYKMARYSINYRKVYGLMSRTSGAAPQYAFLFQYRHQRRLRVGAK